MSMIKTAIASFGMSGEVFHGPLLKVNDTFEVAMVLERTKNNSKKLFPNAKIVRDYTEILNDPSIDLIIVNTPDHLHYEMAKQALEAGKHVVVEKPFTKTLAEAEEIIALAKSKGLIITSYQNRRLDSGFLTVKEVIKSGKLGRLVEFESHYDRYRNIIPENTWKEAEGNYTGSLTNLGAHMIDQALSLFGKPISVTAHLDTLRTGGKILDYYDVRLQYDRFAALLKSSLLVKTNGPRYIVHGELGTFRKFGIDPQEELLKTGALPNSKDWGKEPESDWGKLEFEKDGNDYSEVVPSVAGDYNFFYKNLADAILAGKELLVKPDEIALLMKVLEACIESNSLKKTIML